MGILLGHGAEWLQPLADRKRMMYVMYTLLLMIGGGVWIPRLVWRCLGGAGYHHDLRERFGSRSLVRAVAQVAEGCLWLHAASVGEVQSLQPIAQALHDRFPALPVLVSTFTPAGKRMARRVMPAAATVCLLPVDIPWIVRRYVRRLRPCMVIVQETELWPNLFRALAREHVPVVIVNGRLSPRSYARYRRFRPFMRQVLADVSMVLAQSEVVAQRFVGLGLCARRLRVVGNTNIDRSLMQAEHLEVGPDLTSLMHGRRLLIGGSTHEGEETALLAVYRRLRERHPELLLVLAPRHLERVATVVRHVRSFRCEALRRSQCQADSSPRLPDDAVMILDTLGELPSLYRLCTVAFVGGSLVPIGGHNVLEPAVWAKPLFFGPYMHHFPELAAMLRQAGGAVQVRNADELYAGIARILDQPEAGQTMGQQAFGVLQSNRGALEQTLRLLTEWLRHRSDAVRTTPPRSSAV
jgi:3-deoxy-D-manno-octulosonic-acid transferase